MLLMVSAPVRVAQAERAPRCEITVVDSDSGASLVPIVNGTKQSTLSTDREVRARIVVVPYTAQIVEVTAAGHETIRATIPSACGKVIRLRRLAVIGQTGTRRPEDSPSVGALGGLAQQNGVSVDISTDTKISDVSILGHSIEQIGMSINGVAVPGANSWLLRAVGADLFNGGNVTLNPSDGSAGGQINLNTLRPTRQPTLVGKLSEGTNTEQFSSVGFTGTLGRAGVVAQHARRSLESVVAGQYFDDESGEAYRHSGSIGRESDYAEVRFDISKATRLDSFLLTSNEARDFQCDGSLGIRPCGFGPGLADYERRYLYTTSLSTSLGRMSVIGAYTKTGDSTILDHTGRIFNGDRTPGYVSQGFDREVLSLQFEYPSHAHTISASAFVARSINHSATDGVIAADSTPGYHLNTRKFQVRSETRPRPNVSLSESLMIDNETDIGPSLIAGLQGKVTGKSSTTTIALSSGMAQPSNWFNYQLTDATEATFECSGAIAYIDGPGQAAQHQASTGITASHSATLRGGTTLEVSAQLQDQRGVSQYALIDVTRQLGLDYLARLQSAYSSPTTCGNGSVRRVLEHSSVAGTSALYRSLSLAMKRPLFRSHVMLRAEYSVTGAKLTFVPATIGTTDLVEGSQLPNHPLQRARVYLNAVDERTGVEWFWGASWFGANNSRHLTPYALVNAGMSLKAAGGVFSLLASNVGNVRTSRFDDASSSTCLVLTDGSCVTRYAIHLAPQALFLNYSTTRILNRPRQGASP